MVVHHVAIVGGFSLWGDALVPFVALVVAHRRIATIAIFASRLRLQGRIRIALVALLQMNKNKCHTKQLVKNANSMPIGTYIGGV